MSGSLDPSAVALVVVATALYVRAVRVLSRRGHEVPAWQQAAWHAGMALTAVGLLSPLDSLAEELLTAHMAQHLLIADLAAPLLLIGMRTPVLVFLLPRPALVPLARRHRLRQVLATLARPLVAIPVYALVLYAWHLAPLFEAALRSAPLHALQHGSFVAASLLVWWPALEPHRRHPRGELWKAGHILGARMTGMMLGMALVAMRSPAYAAVYGDAATAHGLTPLGDQQIGGGLMLLVDLGIVLGALASFFWRAGREHDRTDGAADVPPARPAPTPR